MTSTTTPLPAHPLPAPPALPEMPPTHHRRLWGTLFAVAAIAVAVFSLRGKLPTVSQVGHALATAQAGWVAIAAGCEFVSLGMFARQQRALLLAMSVRMSMPRAMAVTYARSAISISMPAGPALSAGFAFQQYRRAGADRDVAAAAMLLSNFLSFVGISVLYLAGALVLVAEAPAREWHEHPGTLVTLAVGAVVAAGLGLLVRRWASAAGQRTHEEAGAVASRPAAIWRAVRRAVSDTVAAGRTVAPRALALATGLAVLNWLTDLLCLAAAAHAFRLPVDIGTIASIYLGVQVVRQIPLTPGGIGLVETGLLAGLAAAGAPGAAAAATVLTYRLLSCWLIIPIGGLAWLGLRRPAVETAPVTDLQTGAKVLTVPDAAAAS